MYGRHQTHGTPRAEASARTFSTPIFLLQSETLTKYTVCEFIAAVSIPHRLSLNATFSFTFPSHVTFSVDLPFCPAVIYVYQFFSLDFV